MPHTDLSAQIAELKAQGMTYEAMLHRLVLAGWPKDTVLELLGHPAPEHHSFGEAVVVPSFMKRYWGMALFFVLTVVFSGLVIGGIYYWRAAPVVYSISLENGANSTALQYGTWPALADPDFYEDVKSRFVEEQASFVVADLTAMKLYVYQQGTLAVEVPILAKGKEGSWWETPVGLYEIRSREENHFSSFGQVYQPWSLAFQGNFFIHGWPYYPGGEPVEGSYSGGCIRLSTEDAQVVYEFTEVGMPVIVHAESAGEDDSFSYRYKTPDIDATAYVAADAGDGTVLASKNTAIQLPVASITKLMSALVVVEYLNLDNTVIVPSRAMVGTARPRLVVGREYTVHDLLILMLTESSNEAAETLAAAVGRERFLALMNEKARAIGMNRSSFIDPSGLEVGNSSTVEDMFTLVKHIFEHRQFIFNITAGTLENDAYGEVAFSSISNYNKIPEVENEFLGGKVGNTNAAKETYAGVFELQIGTTTRPIVAVVLGADDSQGSIVKLLRHLNEFYEPGE